MNISWWNRNKAFTVFEKLCLEGQHGPFLDFFVFLIFYIENWACIISTWTCKVFGTWKINKIAYDSPHHKSAPSSPEDTLWLLACKRGVTVTSDELVKQLTVCCIDMQTRDQAGRLSLQSHPEASTKTQRYLSGPRKCCPCWLSHFHICKRTSRVLSKENSHIIQSSFQVK